MPFSMETIYSKHYPCPELDVPPAEEIEEALRELKKTPTYAEYKEMFKQWDENTVFTPIPGRAEGAERFIEQAKQYSERFQISIDINRCADHIVVALFLYEFPFQAEDCAAFCELMKLCDDGLLSVLVREPYDFAILLSYRTHDGRAMEPGAAE